MRVKKVVLLKKIISSFATQAQLDRYNALVEINKGSSTHYALRLVEKYFEKQCEKHSTIRETDINPSRVIKINGYGRSWMQKL